MALAMLYRVSTLLTTTPTLRGIPASGTITLVTPTYLSPLGNSLGISIPIISTLEIHFVPEPGSLLLVGAGIGGLALLGWEAYEHG